MRHRFFWFVVPAIAVGAGYALWPVCVPLSPQQVAAFEPPIAQRDDTDLFVRVFQQRAGQWHQCKTRASRWIFF